MGLFRQHLTDEDLIGRTYMLELKEGETVRQSRLDLSRILSTDGISRKPVVITEAGYPRNWVRYDGPLPVDAALLAAAVRQRQVVGSTGPLIELEPWSDDGSPMRGPVATHSSGTGWPRSMKIGVPPTPLNARTGELTPPGMDFCARWNNSSDRLMAMSIICKRRLFYAKTRRVRTAGVN